MYIILRHDPELAEQGVLRLVREERTGTPKLDDMQEAVGGYVDRVVLAHLSPRRSIDAWIHDEGRLLNLPATVGLGDTGEWIAGPLLITAANPPDTAPLSEAEAAMIRVGAPHLLHFGEGRVIPSLRIKLPADLRDLGAIAL